MDERDHAEPEMGRLLKAGLAAALVGVTAGIAISVYRFEHVGDILALPGYSAPMLAPLGLGALAVGLAIADMIRRDRYRRPAVVFLLGIGSIAIPFLFALVAAFLVAAMVLVALAHAGA